MRRLAAAAVLAATLTGCTPTEAIGFWFRDDAPAATSVAHCESRLDPSAVSPGGGNHGLFQINSVHRPAFERLTGVAWREGIYDPILNAYFAKDLHDRSGGWGPWTCQPR